MDGANFLRAELSIEAYNVTLGGSGDFTTDIGREVLDFDSIENFIVSEL